MEQRYSKNPDVEYDAESGVCICDGIDVHAIAFVKSIPMLPKEADRSALENASDNKGETPCHHEGNGTPQQALNSLTRKYPDVEEYQAELQKGDLREVETRHDIEVLQHHSDLMGLQCPDMLP